MMLLNYCDFTQIDKIRPVNRLYCLMKNATPGPPKKSHPLKTSPIPPIHPTTHFSNIPIIEPLNYSQKVRCSKINKKYLVAT